MEPKSPKSATAPIVAAMRAVVEGATAEQAAKLTKPVSDTRGFKTASWTSIPTPARMTKVEAPPVAASAAPAAMATEPNPNLATIARAATTLADDSLMLVRRDLAEIRSMLGLLTEAVRELQASAARS